MQRQIKEIHSTYSILIVLVVIGCDVREQNEEVRLTDNGSKTPNLEVKALDPLEEALEFKQGMDAFYKYVMNEIQYPLMAQQHEIEGRVEVHFVVEKDGSLSNVEAILGIGAGCDREAVRVVQKGQTFKPATQRGKPVRLRMALPIIYKHASERTIVVEEAQIVESKFEVDANYVNGQWVGTVYDEKGIGLPGVNITVEGTAKGTVSDQYGRFSLKESDSKDMYFSFIGYESAKIGAN